MRVKKTIKIILDVIMIVLMPILMAQILTGQELHEWLGSAIGVCLIAHNILNAGWYKNLFHGRYTPFRILMTAINLILIVFFVLIMVSGILMSDYVYSWLNVPVRISDVKRLHLFASWWGFILMAGHLGIHWKLIMSGFSKMLHLNENNTARTVVLRIICAAFAAFGGYSFIINHVYEYLFLQTHFMFFDESRPPVLFFLEMTAMIVLFAAAFHYLSNGLKRITVKKVDA